MNKCEFINLLDHGISIHPRKWSDALELGEYGRTRYEDISFIGKNHEETIFSTDHVDLRSLKKETYVEECFFWHNIVNVYAQEVNNGLKIKIEIAWNWGKEENPVGEISTIHYSYQGKYLICWGEEKEEQQLTPEQVRAIQ